MRVRSSLIVLVATLAAPATFASASAPAAELRVDRACFADPNDRADTVKLSGSGFTPGATYQVLLDGRPVDGGTATVEADGTLTGDLDAPEVPVPLVVGRTHRFRLAVKEGATTAQTTFTVSRVMASFTPVIGALARATVRFAVDGLGVRGAAGGAVFVHYVGPDGKLAHTERIGTAGGPCGALRSAARRLFPFTAAKGAWRLQFDARKAYKPGRASSTFAYAVARVTLP